MLGHGDLCRCYFLQDYNESKTFPRRAATRTTFSMKPRYEWSGSVHAGTRSRFALTPCLVDSSRRAAYFTIGTAAPCRTAPHRAVPCHRFYNEKQDFGAGCDFHGNVSTQQGLRRDLLLNQRACFANFGTRCPGMLISLPFRISCH